ncbi:Protein of unknown function DUF3468 [Phaffia rhodozyma]|uniref:Zn(2)-C6 fungal-type DNA-binding domain n=1 Tax=Phaffia rhodozyma TaxID=264483 RepID=A0A0F7SSK5_PHARH|nr:Protein of unknown function DUF3468 [Phaffia rhodozyma]
MTRPSCQACVRLSKVCTWPETDVYKGKRPSGRQGGGSSGIITTNNERERSALIDHRPKDQVNLPAEMKDFFDILESSSSNFSAPASGNGESGSFRSVSLLNNFGTAPPIKFGPLDDFSSSPSSDSIGWLNQLIHSNPKSDSTELNINSYADDLLEHYSKFLSPLVSCTKEDLPSGFEAFTALALDEMDFRPSTSALHLAILSWTGRHLVNQGQLKYESVSEEYGAQAIDLLNASFQALSTENSPEDGGTERVVSPDKEIEKMTLLAGTLMIMQHKICRGDVWGYEKFVGHLKTLYRTLYGSCPDSGTKKFNLLENLAYHDVLSSRILLDSPIVASSLLAEAACKSPNSVYTLTGLSLPVFVRMHQTAELIRERRANQFGGVDKDGTWTDERLLDMVQKAQKLESELQLEKDKASVLISQNPDLQHHHYLHEAFRIACLIFLHTSALCSPPQSFTIRLLVRQALSLLEVLAKRDIPGYCSAHWILFVTGLAASATGHEPDKPSDRERVEKLYAIMLDQFRFLNVSRSRMLVYTVWERNDRGSLFVDWLDVAAEFDWDLFFV